MAQPAAAPPPRSRGLAMRCDRRRCCTGLQVMLTSAAIGCYVAGMGRDDWDIHGTCYRSDSHGVKATFVCAKENPLYTAYLFLATMSSSLALLCSVLYDVKLSFCPYQRGDGIICSIIWIVFTVVLSLPCPIYFLMKPATPVSQHSSLRFIVYSMLGNLATMLAAVCDLCMTSCRRPVGDGTPPPPIEPVMELRRLTLHDN